MQRRAFTAIEALMTIGIIAVTAGVSVPLYRNYQVRSDLNIATEQMLHALRRAQLLARAGEQASAWGVHVSDGILFRGITYDERAPGSDESYPVPPSVSATGLIEVVFSPVSGTPTTEGEIILTAINGDQRIITIRSAGTIAATDVMSLLDDHSSSYPASQGSEGSASSDGSASSNASSDGSASSAGSEGSASSAASSDGSAASSSSAGSEGSASSASSDSSVSSSVSSSSSSSSSVLPGTACEDRFYVTGDGDILTTGTVSASFRVLGSQITYGAGGPEVDVTVSAATDGKTWQPLFGGVDVDGGESETWSNLTSGTRLTLKVQGKYSWMFNRTYLSNDSTGHVQILRKGDKAPMYASFGGQTTAAAFLAPYLDANGRVDIGEYDAILLTELGTLGTSSADFQDLAVLIHLDQDPESCESETSGASSSANAEGPRFKVIFERLENVKSGDAARSVFVGPQATEYDETEWIPLMADGQSIVDVGLTSNVKGLAVERRLGGVVRVLLHGSHPNDGSKEIVDARIVFDGATIQGFSADDGQSQPERYKDGQITDGPGGDEVVISSKKKSLMFYTRVTTADDAILINWLGTTPVSSSSSSSAGSSQSSSSSSNGKKITICHYAAKSYQTIEIAESAWKAHEEHGDHKGSCESDEDGDEIINAEDLCPGTKVEKPKSYLLFFRDMLTENDSDIFREGPNKKISAYTLEDTKGCSCEQLLDVAEGKGGSYFTKLPKLYLQLRSLLDFYVTTARKFGCSRSLLDLIQRSSY